MAGSWAAAVAGYDWRRQTTGRSGAEVFRLEAASRPTLFAKAEAMGALAELPHEIARLRWLAGTGIGCPRVLAERSEQGSHWLLTSAVPGSDLVSSPDLAPATIVGIAAGALRRLHRLVVAECPFDQRLEARIAQARVRVEAGAVDEADFDEERLGRSARSVLDEVLRRRPAAEDLVVAHGDACLPNICAENGRFTGFVDCGRLGVADRSQDLALAARSIRHNLGEAWVEPFLRRYGGRIDAERMAFYRLLDELF